MSTEPKKILKTYWGFEQFRPLQEDIVNAVLEGKDTLALLTTGGGKSVCFQVPALSREGICVVISPLIALMKDQVENLKSKGIKAMAIFSGMTKREIDIALDNAVYGGYKFLYISPERVQTDLFIQRFQKMNVCLIAIDEAHCISQWGYDFRPPYLKLAELRKYTKAPFLALTATATPRVVKDIQEKLGFKKECVYQAEFARPNLRYFVVNKEDRNAVLMSIIRKQKGTGIIYVRSRRLTVEYAAYLQKQQISADYYHAGLSMEERSQRQLKWMKGETRIIVSTNAFGMGIDKPDVRFVINLDLPECLEAYYQEAGRGGRDGNKSYAVLLIDEHDGDKLNKRVQEKFPPREVIGKIYHILCNELRLAIGAGEMETFPLLIDGFVKKIALPKSVVLYSLKLLERAGYISISEGFWQPSRLKMEVNAEQLYSLQVNYPRFDQVLKVILRSYTGLFEVFTPIREKEIAQRAKISAEEVKKVLTELNDKKVLEYLPQTSKEQITFLTPRIDAKYLRFDAAIYENLKKVAEQNAQAMIAYAYTSDTCRSVQLLEYFGELKPRPCGGCDVCLSRLNNLELDKQVFVEVEKQMLFILGQSSCSLNEIVVKLSKEFPIKTIKFVANWLIDNEELLVKSGKLVSKDEQ
jgi:ATP-dependent DNA helicase RecQ